MKSAVAWMRRWDEGDPSARPPRPRLSRDRTGEGGGALARAYAACGEITADYAKTFYLGTKLMTPAKAKAIWAIYVWCRRTDELVDGPNAPRMTPAALDRWEERLEAAWRGKPYDVLDAALSDTVAAFPVDIQPFRDMVRLVFFFPSSFFFFFFSSRGKKPEHARAEHLFLFLFFSLRPSLPASLPPSLPPSLPACLPPCLPPLFSPNRAKMDNTYQCLVRRIGDVAHQALTCKGRNSFLSKAMPTLIFTTHNLSSLFPPFPSTSFSNVFLRLFLLHSLSPSAPAEEGEKEKGAKIEKRFSRFLLSLFFFSHLTLSSLPLSRSKTTTSKRKQIDGMRMDLTKARYATYEELYEYCYRVAGAVGLMTTPIMGVAPAAAADPEPTLRAALALGTANQLTNILRDVGEDAQQRNRVYVPLEDLDRFGISEGEVVAGSLVRVLPSGKSDVDPRWKRFMAFQIERARACFADAEAGIGSLDADARWPVWSALILYRQILDSIEANDYDNFTKRAYVAKWRKYASLPAALMRARQGL